MKKICLVLVFLLGSTINLYAGDFIVDGKAGVGTSNPGAKLEVSGNDSPPSTGASANGNFWLGATSTALVLTSGVDSSGSVGYSWVQSRHKSQTLYYNLAFNPNGGNVGIGTTTPGVKLEVSGVDESPSTGANANGNVWLGATGTGLVLTSGINTSGSVYSWVQSRHKTSQAFYNLALNPNGGDVSIGTANSQYYKLYVNGEAFFLHAYTTGAYWAGSDINWKKNILSLENSLGKVLKLNGVTFEWKADEYLDKNFTKEKQIGLIAQDVEEVLPELVRQDKEGFKYIAYEKLTAVLVNAIKEQQKMIENLEGRLSSLEKKQ